MRYLPVVFERITRVIQVHPAFLALRVNLNSLLMTLKRMNEKYNPLIDSVKKILSIDPKDDYFIDSTQDDLTIDNPVNVCKDESFLWNVFMVASVISFVVVVFTCFWTCRSAENKTVGAIQVEKRIMMKKEDSNSLKELHKVLLGLKYHLAVFPENRKMNPFISNSMTDAMRGMTRRSLYSNVSRKQIAENDMNGEENFAKLRENVQKAVFMLEEQINNKLNKEDDTETDYRGPETSIDRTDTVDALCHLQNEGNSTNHIDMGPWMKFPSSNPTMFLFEKQMDVKSLVTDDADKHKPSEPCKECSKLQEALLFLKQQLDSRPFRANVLNYYKSVDARKCSKSNETQNSQGLNLSLQPSSAQEISKCDCISVEASSKRIKSKDILNVSANKNALNIEILFNRDIQLDKITTVN